MNIVYVVIPIGMLAAFVGYFVPARARLDAELATRAAAEEQRCAGERRAHDEQRRRAAGEQERHAAERIRLQAEKERKTREAQERRDRTLFEDLAQARTARAALRSEVTTLETRLQDLSTERDHADATLHAARAALETRLIERRNADLKLQRMTVLLAEAVDASIVTSTPLFPSPGIR